MTDLRIREATPHDASALFGVQKAASIEAFAHIFPQEIHPFPDEDIRAEWDERLADPEYGVLLAERGERPVGFASQTLGFLAQLYVHPDGQGAGVGSALHDTVLTHQARLGVSRCRLWVLEANAAARAFYERRGWREDGETRIVAVPPNPVAVSYAIAL